MWSNGIGPELNTLHTVTSHANVKTAADVDWLLAFQPRM